MAAHHVDPHQFRAVRQRRDEAALVAGLERRYHPEDVAARQDGIGATDDAALVERLGLPVVVVRGSERALKITEEADFARADALSMLGE